ncbi:unnamed protein product, partial [Prunus brigantina]
MKSQNTKVVLAAMRCLEIGGSLVFLMGFIFLASVTLLVLSSPILLIFIPLLFFTRFMFVGAMTGFAMAGAMTLIGISTLGWIFQELGGTCLLGFGGVAERLKEQFSIGNGAFSEQKNIWERKRTEGKWARRGAKN